MVEEAAEKFGRMETPIHYLVPEHRLGFVQWGRKIMGKPVVIEPLCGDMTVVLEDYGKGPSWHSLNLVPYRLLAIINRSNPDTIRVGVSVSEFTYVEHRVVTGSAINDDPVLGKKFVYST